MSGATDIVGLGLAGGRGVQARPLTLKAPGYLRSKAAMAFLGRRLIRWVMEMLSTEGIKEYYIVAHGKENFVALGDEVVVHPGVRLAGGVSVYPRLKIPTGIRVPPGTELAEAQHVLGLL